MARIQLQESDVLAAYRLHMRPGSGKRLLLLIVAIILVVEVVRVIWDYLDDSDSSQTELLIVLALGGALFGGLLGFHFIDLPRRARRIFNQQKLLRDPVELTWDERGTTFTSPAGSTTLSWEDYLKWKENDRLVLIYHSDQLFNIVPKAAFASPADELDFRRHLARVGVNQS